MADYKDNLEFWSSLDEFIEQNEIIIDRPKGSHHPAYPDLIYPIDYGYLKGTQSADGRGIDIWIGSESDKKLDSIMVIVDRGKKDSEIKLLYGCNATEKDIIYRIHNEKGMNGIIINRKEY
jgi:inorganic pyrophosphatase